MTKLRVDDDNESWNTVAAMYGRLNFYTLDSGVCRLRLKVTEIQK